MNTGIKGIQLIKSFEGFRSKPYLCPAGIATIGYGTTIYPNGQKVKLTDEAISETQAELLLRHDLQSREKYVDAFTIGKITQNQFDALVSFAYNLGVGALKSSTLLKKVNANPNDTSIRNEFMKWVNANGKKLDGLARRRVKEADLYFS